eukprot:11180463-Lingulodinium_polyedra.AAC.1
MHPYKTPPDASIVKENNGCNKYSHKLAHRPFVAKNKGCTRCLNVGASIKQRLGVSIRLGQNPR